MQSSSNGYAKYQIKSSGIDRVLAEESTVFSIDDHDEDLATPRVRQETERNGEKSRLVDCVLDSDEERSPTRSRDNHPINTRQTINRQNNDNEKERSRLTDDYGIDGDSASDDLDLLPPMPSQRTSSIWSRLDCCKYRVPPKCTIM